MRGPRAEPGRRGDVDAIDRRSDIADLVAVLRKTVAASCSEDLIGAGPASVVCRR
jgi:hypothetical protein